MGGILLFSCMIPLDKIAVCLSCGNEWEVRTAGVGKKRKCPVCGKYRVKMKCEFEKDDEKPDDTPPVEAPAEPIPPENTGENTEKRGAGGLFYAVLLLGAAGAAWFFIQHGRRSARLEALKGQIEEESRSKQRIPAFPGF